VSVVGLALLLLWTTRGKTIRTWGKKRFFVATLGAALCAALGLYGNGHRTIVLNTVIGPSQGLPNRFSQADADAAQKVLTSKEFVRYAAALLQVSPVNNDERIPKSLHLRAATTVELLESNIHIEPSPKVGQFFMMVSYEDNEPALFAMLDGGDGLRRIKLVSPLVTELLPEVLLFVLIRNAPSDAEKASLLEGATWTMPHLAEWMLSELDALEKGAEPALVLVIARKRGFLKQYVEDPTMRGLPPGFRVAAPALE